MNSVNAQSEKNLLPGCQVHHFSFFFSLLNYFSWSIYHFLQFSMENLPSLPFFFTPGQWQMQRFMDANQFSIRRFNATQELPLQKLCIPYYNKIVAHFAVKTCLNTGSFFSGSVLLLRWQGSKREGLGLRKTRTLVVSFSTEQRERCS